MRRPARWNGDSIARRVAACSRMLVGSPIELTQAPISFSKKYARSGVAIVPACTSEGEPSRRPCSSTKWRA